MFKLKEFIYTIDKIKYHKNIMVISLYGHSHYGWRAGISGTLVNPLRVYKQVREYATAYRVGFG